jgi:hypothetical protein
MCSGLSASGEESAAITWGVPEQVKADMAAKRNGEASRHHRRSAFSASYRYLKRISGSSGKYGTDNMPPTYYRFAEMQNRVSFPISM